MSNLLKNRFNSLALATPSAPLLVGLKFGDGPHTTPDLPHVILLEFPLLLPSVAVLSLFDLVIQVPLRPPSTRPPSS